jgi:hypothetical protein
MAQTTRSLGRFRMFPSEDASGAASTRLERRMHHCGRMDLRPICCALMLMAIACDDGSSDGGGGSGTAASGGHADSSWDAGGLPDCSGRTSFNRAVAVTTSNGAKVQTSVSSAVTVAMVSSCQGSACADLQADLVHRYELTGAKPEQQWSVSVVLPETPADLIAVGDQLDLTIDVSRAPYIRDDFTLVLSREGKLVVFASNLNHTGMPPSLNLDAYGISVSGAGTTCQNRPIPAVPCTLRGHDAMATVGSHMAVFSPGDTIELEGVSLLLGACDELSGGSCDTPSRTVVSGFRVDAASGAAM